MRQNTPEKTKKLGQYFTPSYLANYIVQNTIGTYLREENLIQPEELFILDPSVGEGIFLVEAKDFLHNLWEVECGKDTTSKEICQKIVFNHLYGIDVDSKKVKLTRTILGYSNYTKNIKTFDALLPKVRTSNSTRVSSRTEWEMNFPSTKGMFHVILGNPPWGAEISEKKNELKYLKSASSQMDSWSLFLERSILGLRDNGYLGFVVPNTILGNPNYVEIRKIILEQCQITHLVNLGEGIFTGVTQPSLILIIRKRIPDKGHLIRIVPRISKEERHRLINQQMTLEECNSFQCFQERFQGNLLKEFDIFAGSNTSMIELMEKDIYSEQKQVTPLSTLVVNGRGVEIGKNGKVLQCPTCGMWNSPPRTKRKCVNSTCEQLLNPSDVHSEIVYEVQLNPDHDEPFLAGYQIQRYYTHEHRYINTNYKGINYKSPEIYQGPKLLLRKTGNIMNWVIDYQNRWVSQVVYIFKRRKGLMGNLHKITHEYLLGVLNSQLMMRYVHAKFFDPARTDFPHFVQNSILNLPIRIPETKKLTQTVQKVGKLALQLQELYQEEYLKTLQSKHSEEGQERIKRVEVQIERSVEYLYSFPYDKSFL